MKKYNIESKSNQYFKVILPFYIRHYEVVLSHQEAR